MRWVCVQARGIDDPFARRSLDRLAHNLPGVMRAGRDELQSRSRRQFTRPADKDVPSPVNVSANDDAAPTFGMPRVDYQTGSSAQVAEDFRGGTEAGEAGAFHEALPGVERVGVLAGKF